MSLFGFKFRAKDARFLAGFSERDGGKHGGFLTGVTTYDTNDDGAETYQTSYVEWGGRFDHLVDIVDALQGNEVQERLVSEAGSDVQYVGTVAENTRALGHEKPKADSAPVVVDVQPSAATALATEGAAA